MKDSIKSQSKTQKKSKVTCQFTQIRQAQRPTKTKGWIEVELATQSRLLFNEEELNLQPLLSNSGAIGVVKKDIEDVGNDQGWTRETNRDTPLDP